jgi:hypothetical protein
MLSRSIYPETPVWNALYDQKVDPEELLKDLRELDATLVISTQTICELAATFTSIRIPDSVSRGSGLFSYLRKFVSAEIPCLKMNKDLLQREALIVTGEAVDLKTTLDERDYINMANEVFKLADGNFDTHARGFLSNRNNLRTESRNKVAEFARQHPELKACSAETSFGEFLKTVNPIDLVKVLIGHLREEFPRTEDSVLVEVAAALLRNPRFRVANTMVRADIYTTWRAARAGSLARDVLDDCYHLVNASYCDVYATKDYLQCSYAPIVLSETEVRYCAGIVPIARWLLAVAAEISTKARSAI